MGGTNCCYEFAIFDNLFIFTIYLLKKVSSIFLNTLGKTHINVTRIFDFVCCTNKNHHFYAPFSVTLSHSYMISKGSNFVGDKWSVSMFSS